MRVLHRPVETTASMCGSQDRSLGSHRSGERSAVVPRPAVQESRSPPPYIGEVTFLATARLVAAVGAAAVLVGCTSPSPDPVATSTASSPGAPTPDPVISAVTYSDVCSVPASGCVQGQIPTRLRRPLSTSPAECGTTPQHQVSPDFGPAAGSGPIYVVLAAPAGQQPVFQYSFGGPLLPPGTQTSKALWISSAKYTGPVLVRGKDLTGSAPVLMYVGGSLWTEMQLPPGPAPNVSPTGWRSWPTQLAVTHSGCYRLQIDTSQSSEHIDIAVTLH